ncbi:MAG: hypothetical protein WAK48_09870 [Candidatus Acidiferrum sp.]
MAHLRLRTQLLVATLLIILTLLGAVLLFVRHSMRSEIAEGVRRSTNASLQAFEDVQKERDLQLSQTAALLADLPMLKGIMATQNGVTIQDASELLWKLAASQVFVLANPDGQIFAFHVSKPGWDASIAQGDLKDCGRRARCSSLSVLLDPSNVVLCSRGAHWSCYLDRPLEKQSSIRYGE